MLLLEDRVKPLLATAILYGAHGPFNAQQAPLRSAGIAVFDSLNAMVAGIAAGHRTRT